MAGVEDLFKNNTAKFLAVGLGAAVLVPVVAPALAGLARPLARAAIKGGIIAYEKSRETVEELCEVFDDLVAEAQDELQKAQAEKAQAATPSQMPLEAENEPPASGS